MRDRRGNMRNASIGLIGDAEVLEFSGFHTVPLNKIEYGIRHNHPYRPDSIYSSGSRAHGISRVGG